MKFTYEYPDLVKHLNELKNKSTKIYFGYPKSNGYAEIAKTLSMGHKGTIEYDYNGEHIVLSAKDGEFSIPPRPFLIDGFMASRVLIEKKVEEYWKHLFEIGVSSTDILGDFIVKQIQGFVLDNPYQQGIGMAKKMPQQSHKGYSFLTGRMATASVTKAKGKAHPLVDSGGMINAMTFVVTHPKNVKNKENKKE